MLLPHRQLPKVHSFSNHPMVLNTQHKYLCMQTQSELINSVCLPLSPFSIPSLPHSYTYTHTHAHRAFAICMHQYERSTQARKRKAELDYLGSLWHERPTDRFLSLPPATLLASRKEEVRYCKNSAVNLLTHTHTHTHTHHHIASTKGKTISVISIENWFLSSELNCNTIVKIAM